MWQCPIEGTYVVIEKDAFVVVCPSEDIQPHDLESMSCPCKTETHPDGNRLTIVHTRFSERGAIEDSVSKLFA
jgi:hypothetical protein